MLAGFFRQFKIRIVSKSNELPYYGQHSGRICRIETTMVKSCAIYLNTTNCSRTIVSR